MRGSSFSRIASERSAGRFAHAAAASAGEGAAGAGAAEAGQLSCSWMASKRAVHARGAGPGRHEGGASVAMTALAGAAPGR